MSSSLTSQGLATKAASQLLDSLLPTAAKSFQELDERKFKEALTTVEKLSGVVAAAQPTEDEPDELYLNDLYVLRRLGIFLHAYAAVWEKIYLYQFAAAWMPLQDALDSLRLIKRFSGIDVMSFEVQLTELEKLFPYNMFCSVGFIVRNFECSICGEDVDSDDCPHRMGRLYRGIMAHAVAKDITRIDHVALVTNPVDKRCGLFPYEDSAHQFNRVRLLANALVSGQCSPLDFSHISISKRAVSNPKWVKQGRNELCFCGSGKKFKKCCEAKREVHTDHLNIITRRRFINLPKLGDARTQ